MSVKQQLQDAKKLIDAGQYDEARAILKSVEHPVAYKWLIQINRIAPEDESNDAPDVPEKQKAKREVTSPNPAKTLVAMVFTFTGIVVLILAGAFLLVSDDEAYGAYVEPIFVDETGCGAQDWVDAVDGSFNEIYRYNLWDMLYWDLGDTFTLQVDEDLRARQITDLEEGLFRLETTEYPNCVAEARSNMITAYETLIDATRIFNPADPLNAFGRFGRTLDLMESTGKVMVEIGARFQRIDGEAIRNVTDPDCPAFAYVTRTMYVDNQFIVMMLVDPSITTLEQLQSFIRDLSQQYYRVKDKPDVPACLWDTRNSFVEMIDAMRSFFEAALGNDLNGMDIHYTRYETSLDQFYVNIENLGLNPNQFGAFVVIRE